MPVNKLTDEQLNRIKSTFGRRFNDDNFDIIDYDLEKFSVGYCRYHGVGTHLYVLVKDEQHKSSIDEVCTQKINPILMVGQLEQSANLESGRDFRIIMVSDMGGWSVY